MDIKSFLEDTPIGVAKSFEDAVVVPKQSLHPELFSSGGNAGAISRVTPKPQPIEWVLALPRIRINCSQCDGERTFNPLASKGLSNAALSLGTPEGLESKSQLYQSFQNYSCSDCLEDPEVKEYALSVNVTQIRYVQTPEQTRLKPNPSAVKANAHFLISKIGEMPKPTKRLGARAKKLVGDQWELYAKGASDEAAGNGIGAFAYYRRVVEVSRNSIVEAICKAAHELEVPPEDIEKIRATKDSIRFSKSLDEIDDLIPKDLKNKGRNPLKSLYSPLSVGLHNRSDSQCLEAAADIRVLLDDLGEKIQRVIDRQSGIEKAIRRLEKFQKEKS